LDGSPRRMVNLYECHPADCSRDSEPCFGLLCTFLSTSRGLHRREARHVVEHRPSHAYDVASSTTTAVHNELLSSTSNQHDSGGCPIDRRHQVMDTRQPASLTDLLWRGRTTHRCSLRSRDDSGKVGLDTSARGFAGCSPRCAISRLHVGPVQLPNSPDNDFPTKHRSTSASGNQQAAEQRSLRSNAALNVRTTGAACSDYTPEYQGCDDHRIVKRLPRRRCVF